jgi:hypothetical protein
MNYKKSLTHILKYSKSLEDLNTPIFTKQIDYKRLKIVTNNLWKKQNKTESDFSLLIDNLSNRKILDEKPILNELSNEVLTNTLNQFDYILNPEYKNLLHNLLQFMENDTYFIFNENKYSKTLYLIFNTINYHNNLILDFKKIQNNINLKLKEKGTAFSSNRDATEVTIPIQNDINTVKKILENNIEVNGISKILEAFNNSPYETITILKTINEDTSKYLKDDLDKQCLEIVLKIKKVLNSSQGLKKEDFIHSMKFTILSFIPYSKERNYGFSSKDKLKDFINDLLELLVNINYIKIDSRDLNQRIQIKDYYKDNPIYEKITKTNYKKHPILDNLEFIKEIKYLIQKSLKIHNNKFQRKRLSHLH